MVVVENKSDIDAFKDYQPSGGAAAKPAAKPAEAPAPQAQAPTPKPAPQQAPTPAPSAPQPQLDNIVPGAPFVPGAPPASGVFASPLAKALASTSGVNLQGVRGTGPGGRIIGEDVVKASQAQRGTDNRSRLLYIQWLLSTGSENELPNIIIILLISLAAPGLSAEAYTDIPNSQIRKVTAQRLTLSKQTIPHYYLTVDCKIDEMMK
jgi:pyruvate dehydrogenase E2 component (dihydrolipoamide acetyltransferase)